MIALLVATAPAMADPMGVTAAIRDNCSAQNAKEIVVCGSREKSRRYRLPRLSHEYQPRKIRAEASVAGMSARINATSVDMPDGQKSNRVMLSIGVGF